MDIVMFITRSSHLRQGSMGCMIVKPNHQNHSKEEFDETEFFNDILAASTNQSLFLPMDSDIHAEIATLGECAQRGKSTKNCTIYITMPPCKRCFGAIVASGIRRIVANREYAKMIQDGAHARNIELVTMDRAFADDQKDRISKIIKMSGNSDDKNRQVVVDRTRRKEERKRRKNDDDEDSKRKKKE